MSNYIRAHFDAMRAVLPERSIPWPAVRAYLIEQGVIDERTTSANVKRTWHREKTRRAKLPSPPARSSALVAPRPHKHVERASSPPSQAADEAKRFGFMQARDAVSPESRKVTPLGPFDRSRVRRWLDTMTAEFSPIMLWLPS